MCILVITLSSCHRHLHPPHHRPYHDRPHHDRAHLNPVDGYALPNEEGRGIEQDGLTRALLRPSTHLIIMMMMMMMVIKGTFFIDIDDEMC